MRKFDMYKRGFAHVLVIPIILVILLATGFVLINSGAVRKTDSTDPTEIPQFLKPTEKHIYPTPTPITSRLNFKKINYENMTYYNSLKYPELNTLTKGATESVDCLVDENTKCGYTDLTNLENRIDDPKILKFSAEIKNHQFSDETQYIDVNGDKVVENRGLKSSRDISYDQICKLNNIYYFLFSGTGPTIHIGGGGSAPSHLAYSDGLDNLIILENISRGGAKNIPIPDNINGEPNPGYTTTTNGGAYYGCRQIVAANNLELVILCGSGDGPSSGAGIFVVDLPARTATEKAFCATSGVGTYKQACYNEQGKLYFSELNKFEE